MVFSMNNRALSDPLEIGLKGSGNPLQMSQNTPFWKIISVLALALISVLANHPSWIGQSGSDLSIGISASASVLSFLLMAHIFVFDLKTIFYSAFLYSLVGIGVLASIAVSFYLWLAVSNAELYFDSASIIVAVVILGQALEKKITGRISAELSFLVQLLPLNARVKRGEAAEKEFLVSEIQVDDLLQLKKGERVPSGFSRAFRRRKPL